MNIATSIIDAVPANVAADLRDRIAGVELGGTKCVCTLAQDGALVAQTTIATTTPAATLAAIAAVLDGWWRVRPFAALGLASFGPLDLAPRSPTYGSIASTSKPGWRDTDVLGLLSRRFRVPCTIDTDVNGAALAERRWGSGRGLADFAYVTVGTGIGVGLIVHGKPTRGIAHCEMGHIRVPRLPGDTAPSGCPFHDDCVEGLASGTAIARALEGLDVATVGVDDPIWARVAHALACLCHAVLCTTGAERIAVGGGVIQRQPHLLARVEALTRASLAGYLPLPEHRFIVAPTLGDQAGPLGAIALALDGLAENADHRLFPASVSQ